MIYRVTDMVTGNSSVKDAEGLALMFSWSMARHLMRDIERSGDAYELQYKITRNEG